MPQLLWSPQARVDLQNIWDHYADEAGFDVADRMIERIYRRCESLLPFPEQGRNCDELLDDARFVVIGSHIAFYRARDGDIEVLHVLHGRQDRDVALSKH
jgi:toxin ParE1/3/4